jgi:DNA polymerase-3 subunit delta'
MSGSPEGGDSVWDRLVGQQKVVAALRDAAAGHGMSHAFLFTGPPGSGRSNAAVAFAAALQCEERPPGCGRCHACHTVLAGSHADVSVVRTERLSIGVREVRDLVRRSALTPVGHRWQIMIVEDADRLTEQACNALLKAIEEPAERTVWILCAPTIEDVLPTIRSRCRLVALTTPTAADVAAFLERIDGVDATTASYAARASQGHIGRARALARDPETRDRRREVVAIPARLTSLRACMDAAARLTEVTKEEADAITSELDAREKADLDAAFGVVERGRRPREYAPALRDLEKDQKTRAKRRHLDVVDRGLMDLVSVYRDAIAVAAGAPGELVNEEIRGDVELLARVSTPETNLRRISAVFEAREQLLEFNVPPALALESMMLALVATEVKAGPRPGALAG